MNKIALFGALALSTFGTFAIAAEPALRIGIEAAYPPFAFKTADGKIAGFDYDIGNELCAQMQVKCQWIEQEFDGLIPSLKVRKVDAVLSSMSITEDRLKSVDFSKKYYHTPGKLVMKEGSQIQDPSVDLKGKKVAVQRASTYDRYATAELTPAGVNVVRYGSNNEAFLDLLAGRVDAVLADVVNIDEGFLRTDGGKGFALVGPDFNDPRYFGRGAGIAVRKGDAATAEKLNAAIDAIRSNGKYAEVQAKYFDYDIYGQ
ncbi:MULTISPECIES: ABC transporter substrate-binding protein [Pseudomonadaceae]|uniref:ABC transporter substrate-binding protein n=1 Tax=Ectopseudomonas alcaliphila TaxID=101564 RepID=A0A1G6WBK3_9GAMM|nr:MULTISPECIES: ABC transporter substrate-binding protein [Pseudomonas]PKM34601.1 MAG: ABC transporter substrate-binding protein [Gammaproteobacteria bacterium HGW-Gammaproteobacteria-12]MDP9937963.1 arginine/ornithine transport system substrate-binding protein [Pseudomonas sp. 3400]MDR7010186.1 arginine/ornithine transport system substrate-binding protein [Pseudomonas alcaliphila]MDX5992006.1 ABC transporter substrate-binding protein [Pseudomonas alcaliphila]SDD63221.1 L-arginine-binding pro